MFAPCALVKGFGNWDAFYIGKDPQGGLVFVSADIFGHECIMDGDATTSDHIAALSAVYGAENVRPPVYVVQAIGGKYPMYYTGRAGAGWLSADPAEAFTDGLGASKSNAERFNRIYCQALGLTFSVKPAFDLA